MSPLTNMEAVQFLNEPNSLTVSYVKVNDTWRNRTKKLTLKSNELWIIVLLIPCQLILLILCTINIDLNRFELTFNDNFPDNMYAQIQMNYLGSNPMQRQLADSIVKMSPLDEIRILLATGAKVKAHFIIFTITMRNCSYSVSIEMGNAVLLINQYLFYFSIESYLYMWQSHLFMQNEEKP